MKYATLIYYLTRHGLPKGTKAHRRESVAAFQRAFTWWNLKVDGIPGPATLRAFKHAAKYGHRISPNFRMSEFRCGCRGRYHTRVEAHVDRDLVRALERARATVYRGPVTIVSGWRCARFNAAVGGQRDSEHLTGRAADIPARRAPRAFARLGFHGLGYKAHGLVTHVDIDAGMSPDTAFKE